MSVAIDRNEDVRRAFSTDASGLVLLPHAVARPKSPEEVTDIVLRAAATRTQVTAAGGQTSTTGASVTDSGILLSLRGLDNIRDIDRATRTARVGPGALIGDLKRAAASEGLLFAPDPTSQEESTIGGAIACNASGARSLRYGATRPHIRALTVVLANGRRVELRRPALEKNTVGYALAQDPVDWFVGSEGTLGIIVEAEVGLLPLPARVIGFGIPFSSERQALEFVVAARETPQTPAQCLEFFDAAAFAIARENRGRAEWATAAGALVYAEATSDSGDIALDDWLSLCEAHGALVSDILVFEGEGALQDARAMRHAVPARMNERGRSGRAEGGRKVSTDWAVPYRMLSEMLVEARRCADEGGIAQPVTYGHAGNGHPHQNFIAADAAELKRVEAVVERTLRHALSLGGTVAAEHGIGKLKRRWLPLQVNALQIGVMRAVKRELDPHGILAPGNVL
ncbi:MAG: FAD-linked oxidase C-terminal domain-containing protein [Gemmatimonadaceae bacterium]